MGLHEQATEVVVTKVATAAQYGGSAGALIFGLRANEFAALCGAAVALAGFVVNWYYQHRRTSAYLEHLKRTDRKDGDE